MATTSHRSGTLRVAGILLLGLCSGAGSSSAEQSLEQEPKAAAPPPSGTDETAAVPTLMVAIFKQDLAQRARVKPQAISVVSAAQQTWPDGSLGCAAPGRSYTPALVPGYRVVLAADAVEYAYHSDRRGHFVLCQRGMALPPVQNQASPLGR